MKYSTGSLPMSVLEAEWTFINVKYRWSTTCV